MCIRDRLETSGRETGEVIWVGDGIATVYGLDHAEYGEILLFETGLKGMVQDIRRGEIDVYKRQLSDCPHAARLPLHSAYFRFGPPARL